MTATQDRGPSGAREITTGQANRVWLIERPFPHVLKQYGDPGRAANEAAALQLLAAHGIPAPRLLAVALEDSPAWIAQTAVHPEPVAAERLVDELAEPLAAVHRIRGPYAGRLAGARRHPTWAAYLHDRLDAYATAAPTLISTATALHDRLDALVLGIEPRLLHHDLQPGHLVRQQDGSHLLLDWELAAFGDPISDLARLAVRLQLADPTAVLALSDHRDLQAAQRLDVYWHIHLLANEALTTAPASPHSAETDPDSP